MKACSIVAEILQLTKRVFKHFPQQVLKQVKRMCSNKSAKTRLNKFPEQVSIIVFQKQHPNKSFKTRLQNKFPNVYLFSKFPNKCVTCLQTIPILVSHCPNE